METPRVYEQIGDVAADMALQGISKGRENKAQGYAFRGIDDVYNALAPLLAKHKLVILPRMLARSVVEREGRNGGALFYVTVEAEFDFVSALDASKHTVRTFGEAMDSGDKATNKAMSAAYKYAAFQAFCIPTEGDNDSENHTHEVAPAPKDYAQPGAPDGYDVWLFQLEHSADQVALREVFGKGTFEQRKHLTEIDREKWTAIKAATPERAA